MQNLGQLFLIFLRIGGFTFGGGYAMLPMIQQELVTEREWATEEEILDYYAIGQCTPGIIAINTATLIGYKLRGVRGALVATTGMVLPSLVVIITIAIFFHQFQDYQLVQQAFRGIKIGVVALIVDVVIQMWDHSVQDYLGVILFGGSFLLLAGVGISPIIVILAAGLIGVIRRDKALADQEPDRE